MRGVALAVALGLALEALLLAFALHASLAFADLCSGNHVCYWLLNGVYMTAGLAFAGMVIPWARARVRLVVGAVLLGVGGLVSLLFSL